MIDEKHFPYILFLQGSNFLTEPITVIRPDGTETILKHDIGSLNRIDRLTSANYSLPINQNSCENIFISMEVSRTSLKIIGVTE
jgi:type II restriction enzyme